MYYTISPYYVSYGITILGIINIIILCIVSLYCAPILCNVLYPHTRYCIVLHHHTNHTYCRLSVPPGAWEGEAMISKCRVRGGDQGVASCPIQLLTSTNTIPQQQIITQDITQQYGVR